MAAKPHVLLDRTGFDPSAPTEVMKHRKSRAAMPNVRSAIGTVEIALWDAAAKIADVPA